MSSQFCLVIHGGAGSIEMVSVKQQARLAAMKAVLSDGYRHLSVGMSALDMVTLAVRQLEDSGEFNAGRGGIANNDGNVELDAAVMDGRTHKAGGVGAIELIKNPILAARMVLEKTEHVLIVSEGAERLALIHGLERVDRNYFIKANIPTPTEEVKSGTVGAVALDIDGNVAAATSTGGWSSKSPGRIGDSPIIGAGTFADNATCAVSSTGHGEYYMRWVGAYDVSALMAYRNLSVKSAAEEVIGKLKAAGGDGGLISVDSRGNIAWPFSSKGMFRGCVDSSAKITTAVSDDETVFNL